MKIECPHCGQHYEVDEEYIGQIANCISCNQEFVIEMIRPDDDIQEKKEKQSTGTSTENRTIEKESVINKPENIEKTKMNTVIQKWFWILVWFWLFFLLDLLLINSCVDYGTEKIPSGEHPSITGVRDYYIEECRKQIIKDNQELLNDSKYYDYY